MIFMWSDTWNPNQSIYAFPFFRYFLKFILAKLPTGLYILLALISFLLLFFNAHSENNYPKIHWTDFRNLFTEWKHFGCRWSNWASFSDISRDVAMATIFCEKIGKLPTFVALAFSNGMAYHYLNVRINSVNDASISCKNFVNFGPVTPELTANLWTSGMRRPKNWRI